MEKYSIKQKKELDRIKISDISLGLPDLKNCTGPKAVAVGKWLINLIENDSCVKPQCLLPTKPELAYLLGVSIGTVQNALRYIEDLNYVESKQCIGTIVKDRNNCGKSIRKLTSKRELAISSIKKYIVDENYKQGAALPSSSVLSDVTGFSANTTRLALEYLAAAGILEHRPGKSKETGWIVKSTDFSVESVDNNTLVQKIEKDLKKYITENLKVGDKLPAHSHLSSKLSVSIKTVHDGLKLLISEGILLARRGRYGTTVIKMPDDKSLPVKKETSIFASAPEAAFYYYEKTQNHIKKMIAQNYEIGAKLPSVSELSSQLDLSPNTIRKAIHNLAKEGYLTFSRGRYGGTFVIDIPEEQSFKWLSVNPKYAQIYKN